MTAVLVVVAGYLLGSLPWSLWVGRHHGLDIREHGSGNLGATNVYRVLGARWGIGVLLLDVGKGTAAVVLARVLEPHSGVIPALTAAAAVTGHMATPFAGFRGGKGVATGLGVFLGLAPQAASGAFLVWVAVVLFCGWVSLASGIAAVALPVFVLLTRDGLGARFVWSLGIAALLSLLILVRHRTNWQRIAAGNEQAIWEKRPETPDGGAL
jgi:glycerol-3-phosphate acyltransferase PlsY